MLATTTYNEIQARYAGTFFGLTWTVLYPLLFLGLYSVVYIFIFRVRVGEGSTIDYVLMIFCGLIPFIGFSEALSSGTVCVVSNKALLNNTLFPIELIPVKTALVSSLTMAVGLTILQVALWLKGSFFLSQLIVPVVLVLQLAFTFGIVWILSALHVFFRDLGQFINVAVLFLMLVSPIAYTIDMIPSQLILVMYFNPLYYLIMLYRAAMMSGSVPLDLLGLFSLISLASFAGGAHVFVRLKGIFAEHV